MAREVITDKIAHRLSRRLRKEAGLGMWRTDHRPVHNRTVPKTRGRRGTMDERAEYFDLAMKHVRDGSRPEKPVDPRYPDGQTEGVRQHFNSAPNPFKGMKRKHRLRIRRGAA